MQRAGKPKPRIMALGIGSFTQAILQILKEDGAEVCSYLTRDHAHYGPSLVGRLFDARKYPDPCALLRRHPADLIIPMSIDWSFQEWTGDLLATGIPILSPSGAGMQLERDRDFARKLCADFNIPFPQAFVARNRIEAEALLSQHPIAFVLKNTLCSPDSPVHTIICETPDDTRSWLRRVNYAEGIFLQAYMGRREAGHIALVSDGEIYSLVSNQEYKRAFDGNMGMVAGAPLGGLVEKDPGDKYGLARALLHPLLPWFRKVGFHGPVQVTAIHQGGRWHVLEYNVRLGVTCGPVILRMLKEPTRVLTAVAQNLRPDVRFHEDLNYGCSLTLAGYGYPYANVDAPHFPIRVLADPDCDIWWNEGSRDGKNALYSDGHRLADVVAVEANLEAAIEKAYKNIKHLSCLSSYYRTDIGRSLWPPGSE
jgi:phosphoribosylamine-glycine ligase